MKDKVKDKVKAKIEERAVVNDDMITTTSSSTETPSQIVVWARVKLSAVTCEEDRDEPCSDGLPERKFNK